MNDKNTKTTPSALVYLNNELNDKNDFRREWAKLSIQDRDELRQYAGEEFQARKEGK